MLSSDRLQKLYSALIPSNYFHTADRSTALRRRARIAEYTSSPVPRARFPLGLSGKSLLLWPPLIKEGVEEGYTYPVFHFALVITLLPHMASFHKRGEIQHTSTSVVLAPCHDLLPLVTRFDKGAEGGISFLNKLISPWFPLLRLSDDVNLVGLLHWFPACKAALAQYRSYNPAREIKGQAGRVSLFIGV